MIFVIWMHMCMSNLSTLSLGLFSLFNFWFSLGSSSWSDSWLSVLWGSSFRSSVLAWNKQKFLKSCYWYCACCLQLQCPTRRNILGCNMWWACAHACTGYFRTRVKCSFLEPVGPGLCKDFTVINSFLFTITTLLGQKEKWLKLAQNSFQHFDFDESL